jgi:hypothetical protein
MADRVRWDITQANFQELRRAAEGVGKVVLTCCTHRSAAKIGPSRCRSMVGTP